MKPVIPLFFAAILMPAMVLAQTIVDDSWADGGRNNGADALDADWWSSTSTGNNSVEVGMGYLGLVTGTSGRGLHGTFAPQTLAVGDTLTATFTFMTPTTVGSETGGGGFRFAIADFNNPGLAADLQSGSTSTNPLFLNLPAYMMDFDVNRPGVADDTSFREHNNPNTTGRFMGTTTEWTSLGNSTDVDYAFTANTEYVAVLSLTRTGADSMNIFGSLSTNNIVLTSHSLSDASGIANNFGLVGVWVNSNLFGSDPDIGDPDNGIDFSNIKIEYVPVPEPSTIAMFALGAAGLLLRRRLKT